MKRLLSLTLVLFLLAAGFASCGTQNEVPGTDTTNAEAVADQTDLTDTDTAADTGESNSGNTPAAGLWQDAKYLEDTTFGEGSKTVTVEVSAETRSVTFTIKTDKTTVADALTEHELISGEEGAYGLYVKYVNGMFADYDTDKSYWSFLINGEYAMTGVSSTEINESDTYKLEYVKE